MKIGAIISNSIISGGGFNQALNAIIQMKNICKDKYQFTVYTTIKENIKYLKKFNIDAILYKSTLLDIWTSFSSTNELCRRIQDKIRCLGSLEKKLIKDNIDLVYFTSPTLECLSLQKINYIATVWDLCHRDIPEFPEVRTYNNFISKDFLYQSTLAQALFTICDSQRLSDNISFFYGINQDRLIAMPFSPMPFLAKEHSTPSSEVLKKYKLKEGYYFYPAQFWAHKNHIRLLQALKLLLNRNIKKHLVFCGRDHGNLKYIKKAANSLNLDKYIHFLGFIPVEDIYGLYKGACAVTMPSYFGPTNLPPLEAWKLETPLIYSSLHSEQAGDAAILANPDSAEDWANAMQNIINPEIAKELIDCGRKHLMQINKQRSIAEIEIKQRLDIFSSRLECWKNSLI